MPALPSAARLPRLAPAGSSHPLLEEGSITPYTRSGDGCIMPRTDTTVINDVIRQVGKAGRVQVEWKIPVERDDGWECFIDVTVSRWEIFGHNDLCIDVHVYGHPTEGEYRGIASYSALRGHAPPSRLTRKWIDQVLQREIETAHAAAL